KTPWAILPDSTSTYLVGGVPWRVKLGVWQFADSEQNNQRSLEISARSTIAPSSMDMRFYMDYATEPMAFNADNSARNITITKDEPDAVIDLTRAVTGTGS